MAGPIAILGAGPSGLTLARLLEIHKIEYVVYERDTSPEDRLANGGSLDLRQGSGLQALQECALYDAFKAVARYDAQEMRVLDSAGAVVWDSPYDGEEVNPEIDRKQLRQILLDSIPKEKIHWGYAVKDVQRESNGQITVEFTNGAVENRFALVVGADGARSKVRKLVTDAVPQYSGVTILQSEFKPSSPEYARLSAILGRGTFTGLGNNLTIIAQRVSNGTYNVYVVKPLPEHWDKTTNELADPTAFRTKLVETDLKDWTQDQRDIVKYSEGPYYPWALYNMPTAALSWKSVPGVTLLGDAAHVTTPWEGEGVNVSMQDSMDLAHAIVKHGVDHLSEAVAEYEAVMLPRGSDLITRSSNSQGSMCGPDAAQKFRERIPEMDPGAAQQS